MSQIIRDITEISRCGAQYQAETFADMGLKSCHASYLLEICAHPGISQDQLASRICFNKSNIARQAAALEENGLLRRVPSLEDKRVLELYPTQKALELLPQITARLGQWEALLTQDITEEETAALEALLLRMRARAAAWMEAH
ncbi:MAG TPA: MarR family transcriptional regulator [Candidatus Faecousia intestinigallinarum]|nr:MarR family transcriptional regulator [Candidatus Faecousia intestinigallinarum]